MNKLQNINDEQNLRRRHFLNNVATVGFFLIIREREPSNLPLHNFNSVLCVLCLMNIMHKSKTLEAENDSVYVVTVKTCVYEGIITKTLRTEREGK